MTDKAVFFKIISLIFVVWAILSTVAFAYYFNQYTHLLVIEENYRDKLLEVNNVLTKLKESVSKINESYTELIDSFQSYISRSIAIVVIDYGNGTTDHFKVYFVEDVKNSVFNITQSVAVLKYKYYSSYSDVLITSINEVASKQVNETSGYYWLFYIDFHLSSYGACHTKVSDGDIIIWNYTLVSW